MKESWMKNWFINRINFVKLVKEDNLLNKPMDQIACRVKHMEAEIGVFLEV